MVDKTEIHSMLVKANRISAWVLFFLVILFILTGFSMTGEYGMNKLIGIELATSLHLGLSELIVVFFTVHSGISIYFALRRWGIIGRKKGKE